MRLEMGVPALVLAPMEGVTDAPMRAALGELGGFSYCVAEFLRVSQQVPDVAACRRHVPELQHGSRTGAGLPVQVQLLGGDPGRLAAAAQVAVAAGAQAIDLNFGCPARTVNRHDGGATLLKDPRRLGAIVAAVRAALPPQVPVSAKLRLGWDSADPLDANADAAVHGGAAWLTVHGRSRAQGYRPPALWRPIGALQRRLPVPVVANGDIFSVDDWRRCREQSGCEHFMLGRGAVADPGLPRRLAALLGGAPRPPPVAVDWPALLRRFVALSEAQAGARPRHLGGRLKQWVKMRHLLHGGPWYDAIKRLEAAADIVATIAALPAGPPGGDGDAAAAA